MTITLDLSGDLHVADNLQSITITNPDGTAATTDYALKRASLNADGTQNQMGLRMTSARWHVSVSDLGGFVPTTLDNPDGVFVPAEDGHITDSDENVWYINKVELLTFATRFAIDTTLEAATTGSRR